MVHTADEAEDEKGHQDQNQDPPRDPLQQPHGEAWGPLAPCTCGSGFSRLLVEDGDESWCPPREVLPWGVSNSRGARLQGGFQLYHDGLFTRAQLLLGCVGSRQHDRVLRQRPELSQLLRVWLFASCAPFSPIRWVGCCKACQPAARLLVLGLGCAAKQDLTPAHTTEICHGLWWLCKGGQRWTQSIP